MSYTVPFPHADMTNSQKEKAALAEVMDYISPKQRETVKEIAASGKTVRGVYRSMMFACMVAGIRGYWPQRALARYALVIRFGKAWELKG